MESESRPLQGLFLFSGLLTAISVVLTFASTFLFTLAWRTSEYEYDMKGALTYHLARLVLLVDGAVSVAAVFVFVLAAVILYFQRSQWASGVVNWGASIPVIGLPLKALGVVGLFAVVLALRWTHWGYSGVTYGRPVRDKEGRQVPLFGQGWRAIAEAEANSVTAFAQLERELMAHGAPETLLNRIRCAAAEEAEHARKAAEEGGFDPPVPIRLPHRPVPSLAQIAAETLEDGCLNETSGARIAALGVPGKFWPTIAVEEAEHAELSWAVLRFCLERGGPEVNARVGRQARLLPWRPGFLVSPRLGVPSRLRQWRIHLRVRAEVARRVLGEIVH